MNKQLVKVLWSKKRTYVYEEGQQFASFVIGEDGIVRSGILNEPYTETDRDIEKANEVKAYAAQWRIDHPEQKPI